MEATGEIELDCEDLDVGWCGEGCCLRTLFASVVLMQPRDWPVRPDGVRRPHPKDVGRLCRPDASCIQRLRLEESALEGPFLMLKSYER